MLKILNPKFLRSVFSKFRHFERILNDGEDNLKIREIWRLILGQKSRRHQPLRPFFTV